MLKIANSLLCSNTIHHSPSIRMQSIDDNSLLLSHPSSPLLPSSPLFSPLLPSSPLFSPPHSSPLLPPSTLGSPCPTRRVRRQSRGYATTVAEHPDKYPNRKFHPGNQIGKGAGNMEDQCMHLQSVHAQTNQKQHLQSAVLGSPRRSAWTPHTP